MFLKCLAVSGMVFVRVHRRKKYSMHVLKSMFSFLTDRNMEDMIELLRTLDRKNNWHYFVDISLCCYVLFKIPFNMLFFSDSWIRLFSCFSRYLRKPDFFVFDLTLTRRLQRGLQDALTFDWQALLMTQMIEGTKIGLSAPMLKFSVSLRQYGCC